MQMRVPVAEPRPTSDYDLPDATGHFGPYGGTFVAETAPGSSEHFNKPGFHLRAAVIEGKGGPFFVRLVGPAKTVAKWDDAVQAFFKSLRVG